jgi:hypothetical protein
MKMCSSTKKINNGSNLCHFHTFKSTNMYLGNMSIKLSHYLVYILLYCVYVAIYYIKKTTSSSIRHWKNLFQCQEIPKNMSHSMSRFNWLLLLFFDRAVNDCDFINWKHLMTKHLGENQEKLVFVFFFLRYFPFQSEWLAKIIFMLHLLYHATKENKQFVKTFRRVRK